jgi:hypothetical protein
MSGVFRSTTSTGLVVPRVFQNDTAEDRLAAQEVIGGIDMYPLAEYDGTMKRRDWSRTPKFPAMAGALRKAESRWVFPQKFLHQLPFVLRDAPPLEGEEARYAEVLAVVAATRREPALRAVIVDEVVKTEMEVVRPLLQFRNFGIPLPHCWTTANNGSTFGTDYFTRTAMAKSNILVNKPNETKYFCQDLDASGVRLNSGKRYRIKFASGHLPPVKGLWSLSLYNTEHFFVPNPIKRYAVGTKSKHLERGSDGSLTIYIQSDAPGDPAKWVNWLPSPKNQDFSLLLRAYWPDPTITRGDWTPPAVEAVK